MYSKKNWEFNGNLPHDLSTVHGKSRNNCLRSKGSGTDVPVPLMHMYSICLHMLLYENNTTKSIEGIRNSETNKIVAEKNAKKKKRDFYKTTYRQHMTYPWYVEGYWFDVS